MSSTWATGWRYTAEWGLAVLPLEPGGKRPLTRHGCKDASSHHDAVTRWEREHPRANLGIATGGGLLVLDFDAPDAGDALTARFGARPRTWTATTPRGGTHEYYGTDASATFGNTCARLAPKVDTRGAGGFVVAPPSTRADGARYAWTVAPWDAPLAALPEAIAAALRPSPPPVPAVGRPLSPSGDVTARVGAYVRQLPALADGQGRNLTAYRLAAFVLHDCGGSAADARVALDVWNARNLDPLPAAALDRAVRNAARYGGRRHAA